MTSRFSPTADLLKRAIQFCGRSQRDIAFDAGFPNPNIITMFKTGQCKIPIERIPDLAYACNIETALLLRTAMDEYYPESWDVVKSAFGEPLTRDEKAVLRAYRSCTEKNPKGLCSLAASFIEIVRDE